MIMQWKYLKAMSKRTPTVSPEMKKAMFDMSAKAISKSLNRNKRGKFILSEVQEGGGLPCDKCGSNVTEYMTDGMCHCGDCDNFFENA